MSNEAVFDLAFNKITTTVQNAFYQEVEGRMAVLKTNVTEEVKGFFEEISLAIGGDEVPSEIAGYTGWDDLTYQWIKRKKSPGNQFQVGKSGGMRRFLANRGGKTPYGEPVVTLGEGLGRGFSNTSGRVRVAKGFQGAGRFAASALALRATVTVIPFPKANDWEGLTAGFKGKAGQKVWLAEYGWGGRPSRPFLYPFMRFYTDVQIPGIISRTIRS